jgi:hypothetical protein
MASCTSLFTGPPLTAGVDAPAIEYPATGDQPQQDVQQRYSASMAVNISRQYAWGAPSSIRSGGAVAARGIPEILIVREYSRIVE